MSKRYVKQHFTAPPECRPHRIGEIKPGTAVRIPADWEEHSCCWMAWAIDSREWNVANSVKRELSEVIQTIGRFEPVRVLARRGTDLREARREFSNCANIDVIEAPVDDIWMRDIAPTFAWRSGKRAQEIVGIDWNFNGWGNTRERRARPGDLLAKQAEAIFGASRISTNFIGEGGAFVSDGDGTLITTRSCLLNPNRNPVRLGLDRERMIATAMQKLGIRKILWLEGDPSEPITSGHIDAYVLPAPGGALLVEEVDGAEAPFWREHDIYLLGKARDANGRVLELFRVLAPRLRYLRSRSKYFCPSYVNVYVANGAVVGVCFGDEERDERARDSLAKAFPGRKIVLLRIDNIVSGGGGVHCLTQPMPMMR